MWYYLRNGKRLDFGGIHMKRCRCHEYQNYTYLPLAVPFQHSSGFFEDEMRWGDSVHIVELILVHKSTIWSICSKKIASTLHLFVSR